MISNRTHDDTPCNFKGYVELSMAHTKPGIGSTHSYMSDEQPNNQSLIFNPLGVQLRILEQDDDEPREI